MITCFSRLSEKYFSHQYCVCFHINHKCYIVSVVFRLITQSSSLYFHWFHVFKSSVFDLILNIVLEVDVWTLSKRFSQILVLLKSIYLVLFVLFVCVVFFIQTFDGCIIYFICNILVPHIQKSTFILSLSCNPHSKPEKNVLSLYDLLVSINNGIITYVSSREYVLQRLSQVQYHFNLFFLFINFPLELDLQT